MWALARGAVTNEEAHARPGGWRRVRVPGIRRSGPPSTRTQLEELRTGERVTEPEARDPYPASGPARLMGESFRREPLTRESVTRDSHRPRPTVRYGYFFTSIEPFMLGWRAQL